ncbi:transmembrane protein, putative, partial [Rhizoctonia solani AG-3 Rhs1AP]
MINVLVNRPNHSSTKPVYLRLPRSQLYLTGYLALFGVGLLGTTGGLYSLIKASHKSYRAMMMAVLIISFP